MIKLKCYFDYIQVELQTQVDVIIVILRFCQARLRSFLFDF